MDSRSLLDNVLIPAQLATAMLGMGATLKLKDFKAIIRSPTVLFLGLVFQIVLIPVLALLWARLFGLGPYWQLGLLMVAAVPGGAWSNLLTFFGRGNVPLSISITIATTMLAMATTPLVLKILAADLLPDKVSIDVWDNMKKLAFYAILPLCIGVWCAEKTPFKLSKGIARWFIRTTTVCLVLIVTLSLTSGRIKIDEYGIVPPIFVLSFLVMLLVVMPHISRVLKLYDEENIAISVEVIVRNINIALFMIPTFGLPEEVTGKLFYVCLFFGGASGLFAMPIVLVGRYRWFSMVWGRRENYREPLR